MIVGVVVVVLEIVATVLGLLLQKKKPKPNTDSGANVVCVAVNDCDTATTDRKEIEVCGDERTQRQNTTLQVLASSEEERVDACINRQR